VHITISVVRAGRKREKEARDQKREILRPTPAINIGADVKRIKKTPKRGPPYSTGKIKLRQGKGIVIRNSTQIAHAFLGAGPQMQREQGAGRYWQPKKRKKTRGGKANKPISGGGWPRTKASFGRQWGSE